MNAETNLLLSKLADFLSDTEKAGSLSSEALHRLYWNLEFCYRAAQFEIAKRSRAEELELEQEAA